jgi:hypothetical protein
MLRTWCTGLLMLTLVTARVDAGLYSGPTDTTHAIDPAIPSSSPLFKEWANSIDPTRTQFAPRGSSVITLTGTNSLGDLDAAEIAAGASPGYLTVTFPRGIRNVAGADFAVFENGFTFGSPNGLFAEFAYVEASSNGVDFARFPSVYTNTAPVAVSGPFAGFDVSNIHNLAGKHASSFGTPFNLDELVTDPLVASGAVKLAAIKYVKLVDIPGNGAFLDSLGNGILDNWLTVGSGGFDFRLPAGQGVGVINAIPEPVAAAPLLAAAAPFAWQSRKRRYRRA